MIPLGGRQSALCQSTSPHPINMYTVLEHTQYLLLSLLPWQQLLWWPCLQVHRSRLDQLSAHIQQCEGFSQPPCDHRWSVPELCCKHRMLYHSQGVHGCNESTWLSASQWSVFEVNFSVEWTFYHGILCQYTSGSKKKRKRHKYEYTFLLEQKEKILRFYWHLNQTHQIQSLRC